MLENHLMKYEQICSLYISLDRFQALLYVCTYIMYVCKCMRVRHIIKRIIVFIIIKVYIHISLIRRYNKVTLLMCLRRYLEL